MGVLYTICMVLEMYGLQRIDTGMSALIENMAIGLVPIYVAVWTRKWPEKRIMLCAVLAVIGVGFLSIAQIQGGGSSLGILLAILAAMDYALCIIATGAVSRDADPVTIGVVQMGAMGVLSLVMAFVTGGFGLPQSGQQWGMMLMLILVCSCFGFVFQPLGQKYVSSETAAVFTVANPLTASIMGMVFAGEVLTVTKAAGYLLILIALFLG